MNYKGSFVFYLFLFLWLIPPVRQYKTKYFFYFLIQALNDFAGLLYVEYINPKNNLIIYFISAFLCLIAVLDKKYLAKFYSILWILLFVVLIIFFEESNNFVRFTITSIVHFAIILVLLNYLIMNLYKEKRINFFIFFMILYEGTVATKLISILSSSLSSWSYYYFLTSLFDLFMVVVFILFKYGSKRLILQLK